MCLSCAKARNRKRSVSWTVMLSRSSSTCTESPRIRVAIPGLIILMNFPRLGQKGGANVTIRGVGPDGPSLRPQFHLIAGRYFHPGLREVIVSKQISERFQNCSLGDKVKFAKGYWTVVGIFEAGHSAYDSEIWTDVHDLEQDFDRPQYSD